MITTGANDRAHLVFLDGTSLTVGPNARLTIDKFVFDPNTKKGDLAINASKGVFRLVGGKISKTNAITVTTPSSTIGIRGGITIFAVTPSETIADLRLRQQHDRDRPAARRRRRRGRARRSSPVPAVCPACRPC